MTSRTAANGKRSNGNGAASGRDRTRLANAGRRAFASPDRGGPGLGTDAARRRIRKTPIRNPDVLNEAYDYPKRVPFARGMRVELPGCVLIFISGTASVNERGESVHRGDVAAQTRRTFANITGLLEREGADWHDVVRTTCYLVDFRDYDAFNRVRSAFYAERRLDPFPASTCVGARLCRPELLVEIEAIAILPATPKRRGHGGRRQNRG